ncbi:MAG: glycerol-3-phosphate 1-O-acyltransferase PlsY [Candidatus Neomarinimicrobiota bacterium]|nr:glycerol-3-phosphate 1-O-acyltransferase PlsY [Candidatus Neomarinimicrobiota bacterium]
MDFFIVIVISYVVGSLPTSIIVARKIAGIDIREHGSGNAGMSNVVRVIGLKPGIVVGMVDILKGWLATAWIPIVFMASGGSEGGDFSLVRITAGGSAVLGHTYTIFSRFRGGKGVATLAGVMIALYPIAVVVCFLTFGITFMKWGYVSLSSMTAAVTLPLSVLLLPWAGLPPVSHLLLFFSLFVPLFVFFTHRENIARLRRGNEKRFDRATLFSRRET